MEKKIKIKEGINLHFLNSMKYKTNIISVFLTTKLQRENVTKEALIPAILRLGTNDIKNQKELNKVLDNMYGAGFNCGVEKRGDNHVLKFYIETINDEYTLNNEKILNQSIEIIWDIILNPFKEDEGFSKEYVRREKENLKRIIESRKDNKGSYAYSRCLEEMYKERRFGIYEYGYIEDLEKIDEKKLYKFYKEFMQKCKVDIFISGNIVDDEVIINNMKSLIANKYPVVLEDRKPEFIKDSKEELIREERTIEEKMNITQGKLVIGIGINNKENIAANNVYNAILGGGANSKLFQNVREKASLAYSASSAYIKSKNIIMIRCGIEIKNYEKTVQIIKEQLEDMKNGKFTDKDICDAKELIIGSLKSAMDEQSSQISYEFSKELFDDKIEIDDYINKIKKISKKEIIEVAMGISIDTKYFLKN